MIECRLSFFSSFSSTNSFSFLSPRRAFAPAGDRGDLEDARACPNGEQKTADCRGRTHSDGRLRILEERRIEEVTRPFFFFVEKTSSTTKNTISFLFCFPFLLSSASFFLPKMRPLLDELPRTRSSLRVSSQDGGKSSSSSIVKGEAAAWNASSPPRCQSTTQTKRNQSTRFSSFLALAVAAGVALGLLFGARDALVRGSSVLQSTLASELVERLESQVCGIDDWRPGSVSFR